jgi:FixJ family two-component response regulator
MVMSSNSGFPAIINEPVTLPSGRLGYLEKNAPFGFLDHTINLCMVDDEPLVLKTNLINMKRYPLYNIFTASSALEAKKILTSGDRIHVCLMDLGLDDIDGDEFYLLKKYSPRTSFIVLTGDDSIHRGFQCGKHGSFSVIEKPVDFGGIDFIKTINEAFIQSLVTSGKERNYKPVIEKIITALLHHNPDTISEWAFDACITEQYLRRTWNTVYGYQPKYFLWFYKTVVSAFSYYNKEFLKMNRAEKSTDGNSAGTIDKQSYFAKHCFRGNKKIIDAILIR